jgi:hypothetical protein
MNRKDFAAFTQPLNKILDYRSAWLKNWKALGGVAFWLNISAAAFNQ